MKSATADGAGAQLGTKREQRRWARGRGENHGWKGRRYLIIYHSRCDRGMSASHEARGHFSKLDRETRSLTSQLRDDRDLIDIEEFNSRGGSVLWLYVERLLKWAIAAPGATLPSSGLDIWCWRLQHYDSSRECMLSLPDVEQLTPVAGEWSRAAHLKSLEGLKRLQAEEVGDLEVLITELEEEMRLAKAAGSGTRPAERGRQWVPSALDFRPVAVRWLSTPGLAAGSGRDLTVGEEHRGRFRIAFVAEQATAEAEVDLKRSMVTVHRVEGQPPLWVAGRPLEAKLSLPVTDDAIGENPPELRSGRQLDQELKRVVCIG